MGALAQRAEDLERADALAGCHRFCLRRRKGMTAMIEETAARGQRGRIAAACRVRYSHPSRIRSAVRELPAMPALPLYPLRFEPIFKSALWGGRRLAALFPTAPAAGPLAEAWVLSDQDDNVSRVARRVTLAGTTLRRTGATARPQLAGAARLARHGTFPLLLKYIDGREPLLGAGPPGRHAGTISGRCLARQDGSVGGVARRTA